MNEKFEQSKTELEKYKEIFQEILDEEITDFDEIRFMKFFKAGVSLYKPAENCKYDSLFNSGTGAQLEKLQENEHKSGFDDIDVGFAFMKLWQNMEKVHPSLCKYGVAKKFEQPPKKQDVEEVRARAANIANFAHMVILKCDKEIEKCSE